MIIKHISDNLLLTNKKYLNSDVQFNQPVLFHYNYTKYSLYIINIIRVFLINSEHHKIKVEIKTIENLIGSHGGNVRNSILQSFDELNHSFFTSNKSQFNYFKNYFYDEQSKLITLELEKNSVDLLYNYINEKLLYFYIFSMKSKYGIALYELLMTTGFKFLNIDVESLKKYLRIDKKYSGNNLSNLKRTIINPAINDINSFSLYNISYEIVNNVIYFAIKEKPTEEQIKINESLLSNKEIKYNILKFYMSN